MLTYLLKDQATEKSEQIHRHLNPAVLGVGMGEKRGQRATDGSSTEGGGDGCQCVTRLPMLIGGSRSESRFGVQLGTISPA